jgi:hypothetical protein
MQGASQMGWEEVCDAGSGSRCSFAIPACRSNHFAPQHDRCIEIETVESLGDDI